MNIHNKKTHFPFPLVAERRRDEFLEYEDALLHSAVLYDARSSFRSGTVMISRDADTGVLVRKPVRSIIIFPG